MSDGAFLHEFSQARRPRRSPPRGHTLVELAAVVAVLGVIASLAAPSLGDTLDRRRLQGTASVLATDLRFVRAEALARGEALRFSLRPMTGGSCYVIHTGTATQCDCDGAEGPAHCAAGAEAIRTVRLPAADRVALQANVASMRYDPVHGTTTPTGTWRVIGTASNRAVHHVVGVLGRVRSCSPDGTVPGYRPC